MSTRLTIRWALMMRSRTPRAESVCSISSSADMALAPRYSTALKSKFTTGVADAVHRWPHWRKSATVSASSSVNGGDKVSGVTAVQVTRKNYEIARLFASPLGVV